MTDDPDPLRNLRRMENESERLIGGQHSDIKPEDRIELLGRRIGRILSVALATALLVYLFATYVQP
jgi:hypothetical protein